MTGEFHLALDPGRQSCAKFLASNANLYTFESRQTLQDTWMLDRVDDAEGIFYQCVQHIELCPAQLNIIDVDQHFPNQSN